MIDGTRQLHGWQHKAAARLVAYGSCAIGSTGNNTIGSIGQPRDWRHVAATGLAAQCSCTIGSWIIGRAGQRHVCQHMQAARLAVHGSYTIGSTGHLYDWQQKAAA